MLDGNPNPNTYAYGHRDLVTEVILVAKYPEPGAELVITKVDERFKSRHAGVIRRLQNNNTINKKEPENEFLNNQFLVAKRIADARPGSAIRMGEVIKNIIERENIDRPVSLPFSMQAPPTPQRAGPSG